MATQELALINSQVSIQPYNGDRLPAVQQLGAMLAKSGYFSDAREAAQAAVKVMAGEELGLAPVASMMGINIIKGKVALSANLMAAQVRRHGYNYRVKSMDAKGCVIDFIAKDGKTVLGESSFNDDDAKAAEIKSDMYKKYPRNMFFSRAMSNGVKWFCPEVTSGLPVYTPEEMGARVDGDGEVIQDPIDTRGIDTGGHPVGTQAAASHVADRKIAEMKSAPKSADKSKDFAMLKAFGEIKKQIGDKSYYVILGNNGYEHANEITNADRARAIYKEMAGYLKSMRQKSQQPDGDIPAEMERVLEGRHPDQQPAAAMADQADVWEEGRE